MSKSGLYPIYGTCHVPFWQTTEFYVVVLGLCVVLFSVLLWYGAKKYRLSKKGCKEPWKTALNELEKIEKERVAGSVLGGTFYFKLTWVFKRYLSERYGFDVYGKTDEELLLYLEGAGLASKFVQDLSVIFEGSEVIKFAKEAVAQDRMERDLQASIEFIKNTTPSTKKN